MANQQNEAPIWSVEDIVKTAGGNSALSRHFKINRETPYKWRKNGIGWRYWDDLIALSGGKFNYEQIMAACWAADRATKAAEQEQ